MEHDRMHERIKQALAERQRRINHEDAEDMYGKGIPISSAITSALVSFMAEYRKTELPGCRVAFINHGFKIEFLPLEFGRVFIHDSSLQHERGMFETEGFPWSNEKRSFKPEELVKILSAYWKFLIAQSDLRTELSDKELWEPDGKGFYDDQ